MDANDRRERAASEAADWFTRLQAGTMERAEREQFVEWLRESHVHVAEMLRVAQLHGSLAHFPRWARIPTGPKTAADDVVQLLPASGNSSPPPESPPPRRTVGHGLRRFAIAATVLLIAVVAVVLPQIRGQIIQTDRGERRELVLSDGSLLQVDPETRLRVKFTDGMRRVFLDRGRALFHVAKNPDRPFLVYANDTAVRAVGTVFAVEQRTRGVVVTVSEGKVAVSARDSPSSTVSGGEQARSAETATSTQSARRALLLTANQQVIVAKSGAAEPVREVDSQRALAWAEGRLIFQNDDIGWAVAQFNRYNRVKLTVTDPVLAAKPVSGVFNAAEPEAFIAFLQSVTPVEIERDGDRSITIGTPRGRAEDQR